MSYSPVTTIPAGRLPFTFCRSADQLPTFGDYRMDGRTYRYSKGEALHPFGQGLTYTRFHYANPRLSSPVVPAAGFLDISVDVTNTGGMDGDEVAQVYVTYTQGTGAPLRSLQGFQRVRLTTGEAKTLTFRLKDRGLSTVDSQGIRSIRSGKINVWIGGGQPVSRAGVSPPPGVQISLEVEGLMRLPL